MFQDDHLSTVYGYIIPKKHNTPPNPSVTQTGIHPIILIFLPKKSYK